MKKLLIMFFLLCPALIFGQSWKENPFSISIFNNATMLPSASITAAFNQPIHFGVNLNYEFGWKTGPRHKWFQNAGLTYIYHRFVYQALMLNTQGGYRWKFKDFSVAGYLQAGYMHFFYLTDRAVQQPDGSYKSKQGAGKPQFYVGAGLNIGYNFGKENRIRRLFLGYDIWIEMPFVKSYVPLLPNGAICIGFQFNLK